jgi:transcriptional regulator with XRE-family HTH domain
MTQEEFASRCGISVSFASLLERGERSPSYETLVQIADALQIALADLFRNGAGAGSEDPYYTRLLEFARRKRLSRAQVDRLIAVGHAVFDPRAEPSALASSEPRMPHSKRCAVESCGRPALAKGLCPSHYHRARRERQ